MRKDIKTWLRALAIAIVGVPMLSLASDLTTPNSFTAGTPALSAQVNANFAAVQTAVNSKQDAITTSCPAGQAISAIAAVGGAVTCTAVGAGPTGPMGSTGPVGPAGPTGPVFGASITGNSSTSGVIASNAGAGAGIEGDNSGSTPNGYGVLGQIVGQPPGFQSAGVKGASEAFEGIGVWGDSVGAGIGVYGTVDGTGNAVEGFAPSGVGVLGESQTAASAGVQADNGSGATGMALSIQQGYFQVQGAGSNTSTTAFVWTANDKNDAAAGDTVINNPMTNGNPNLILTITPNTNYNTALPAVMNPHPVGVFYDTITQQWVIINEDSQAMTYGASFNVLVISP